jgi:hypothetical protein
MIAYSSLELVWKVLTFYGARVGKISWKTTHIICDPEDQIRMSEIKKFLKKMKAKKPAHVLPVVVSKSWVFESIANRADLDERDFLIEEEEESL